MSLFSECLYYHEWHGDCHAKNESKTLLKQPFRSYLYKFFNFWCHINSVLTALLAELKLWVVARILYYDSIGSFNVIAWIVCVTVARDNVPSLLQAGIHFLSKPPSLNKLTSVTLKLISLKLRITLSKSSNKAFDSHIIVLNISKCSKFWINK
jgi:hypothetical protein